MKKVVLSMVLLSSWSLVGDKVPDRSSQKDFETYFETLTFFEQAMVVMGASTNSSKDSGSYAFWKKHSVLSEEKRQLRSRLSKGAEDEEFLRALLKEKNGKRYINELYLVTLLEMGTLCPSSLTIIPQFDSRVARYCTECQKYLALIKKVVEGDQKKDQAEVK